MTYETHITARTKWLITDFRDRLPNHLLPSVFNFVYWPWSTCSDSK